MKKKVVVLGGGVGGLSAGWMLARTGNYEVTIVERAPITGGACGTFEYDEFLLDYGPHKSYSVIPGIIDELKDLMGDEFLKHQKSNRIYMFNSFLRYPIRMTDLVLNMGPKNLAQCGLSAITKLIGSGKTGAHTESYETYLVNKFGRKVYELVFEPLAEKIWGDPSTLSAEIAKTRIPGNGILDVAMRAMGVRKESEMTDAKYFYYPRQGFGRIPKRMEEEIIAFGGKVLTDTEPTNVYCKGSSIIELEVGTNGNSSVLPCDLVISSIPIEIVASLLENANICDWKDKLHEANNLQYRCAILVYVILDKKIVTDDHWIFFPERDVIFSRIFEQKKMSQEICPEDRTVICCDFTDSEGGSLWNQTDERLSERCILDLEKVGIIKRSWVEQSFVKRFPRFYPRYHLQYKETIATIYNALKQCDNLLLTGRIGFYNYSNSDHCVDMGRFIAQNIESGKRPSQIWTELEQRVAEYRIVD